MPKPKSASERVATAQAKAAADGAERLTLTLYGEDADLWREHLGKFKGHGSKMAAFRAALESTKGEGLAGFSKSALLAEVARRMK